MPVIVLGKGKRRGFAFTFCHLLITPIVHRIWLLPSFVPGQDQSGMPHR